MRVPYCSLGLGSYFYAPRTTPGADREVAEWSNATVSKTVIPATVSGVRIPPSLQKAFSTQERAFFLVSNWSCRLFLPREVAEWSIAAVLKTADCNRSGGSNPSFSAPPLAGSLNPRFRPGGGDFCYALALLDVLGQRGAKLQRLRYLLLGFHDKFDHCFCICTTLRALGYPCSASLRCCYW